MSRAGTGHMAQWASRPLCAEYFFVSFGWQTAALSVGSDVRNLSFCWALGTLDDGQAEILGWWFGSQTGLDEWSTISTDLTARGVKRIRVLAAPTGALINQVRADSPCIHGDASSSHPLSEARKRRIADASAQMCLVRDSLSRAFSRHSALADADSIATLVDRELQHLDHRLWSHPDVAVQRSSRVSDPMLARAVTA